jgi:hypothetical protein
MNEVAYENPNIILSKMSEWAKLAGEGVSIATFAGFNSDDQFLVALSDELEPIKALSTIGLDEHEAGAKIVVAYERNNVRSPIIIGRLQEKAAPSASANFKVDGERLVLHGEREIELRCGDASIVLTKAGKVLIKGNYVLTRSRGANKIKGAYIDIN